MWKRKTFVSSIIIVIIIITITTAATTTYYPCYYVATWHFKADPALYFPAASGWAGHRFGILFWDNSEAVTVSSPRGGKALGMRPSRSIATSEEVLTSVSCPRHPLLRPSLSLSVWPSCQESGLASEGTPGTTCVFSDTLEGSLSDHLSPHSWSNHSSPVVGWLLSAKGGRRY